MELRVDFLSLGRGSVTWSRIFSFPTGFLQIRSPIAKIFVHSKYAQYSFYTSLFNTQMINWIF